MTNDVITELPEIDRPVTLEVAVELIPMISKQALYNFLGKHKDLFPGRYQKIGGQNIAAVGYEVRVLKMSEIAQIQKMVLHGKAESRFARAGRPPGTTNAKRGVAKNTRRQSRPHNPMAFFIQKALAV